MTHIFKLHLQIAGVLLAFSASAGAQTPQVAQPSALGINGFYNLFKDPVNSKNKSYQSGTAGVAISYQKGVSKQFVFNMTLSGSILDFVNKENIDIGNGNKQLLLELDADIRYLLLANKHIFQPFLQAGIGGSSYANYWGSYIPLGLGSQINITPSSFILIQAQQRLAITSNQDNHYYFSIGLAGDIGRSKQKKPAAKPAPPKDTDGDGIFDIDDACPTVPGVVRYRGCPIPDRDGDGINDEEDHCPDVPGILKYAGCPIPDRDHDGINDEIDRCPDTPGVARYQGCPIPDRDHDGLNDEEDQCPDEPGPISNKGCPLLNAAIRDKVKLAAENCFFETGKYQLLPASFKSLNDVVDIMKSDSLFHLEIRGYTDNRGKPNANQLLSENRAKAVSGYLISKGISSYRLTATGFGQTNPIAENNTATGRAKNRRVEMKISIQRAL